MENIKANLVIFRRLFIGFLKWCLIGTSVGGIVGLIGAAFHLAISKVTEVRTAHSLSILLLPLCGLAIVFLYKKTNMSDDKGTNSVILAVRSDKQLPARMAFLIFISSIMTHLFGGSAGREGAALQIGGSIAAKVGRIIKLDEFDATIITMCGMSAGFAALFGTPVASAVFAMEVISVGIMHYSAFVPCIIAALTGSAISSAFGIKATAFSITLIPEISVFSFGKVILLAVCCAVVSIVFCVLMRATGEFSNKIFKSAYAKAFVGGGIIVILTFVLGTHDYNGTGMDVITNAFSGDSVSYAFVLKILFTVITLSAGFKGGEIVPVLFIGATFGNAFSHIIGLSPSFGAGIGIIAMFCGVTNCPLASLFLSIELFGGKGLLFFAVASAVSYNLSGYEGVFSEQKILYSKMKPKFINKIIGGE